MHIHPKSLGRVVYGKTAEVGRIYTHPVLYRGGSDYSSDLCPFTIYIDGRQFRHLGQVEKTNTFWITGTLSRASGK